MMEIARKWAYNLITPERPRRWGRILMYIISAFYIASTVSSVVSHSGMLSVISSILCATGCIAGSVYMTLSPKRHKEPTLVIIALCLCLTGEVIYTTVLLHGSILSKVGTELPLIMVGLTAWAMYIYILVYYLRGKSSIASYNNSSTVRLVLAGLLFIMTMFVNMREVFLIAEKDITLILLLSTSVTALISVLLVYGPWCLCVASDQYPDAKITRREARRIERRNRKRAERRELNEMWRAAMGNTARSNIKAEARRRSSHKRK